MNDANPFPHSFSTLRSAIEPASVIPARFRPPRAAYIHVPFCRHRCGYCNFTLVAGRDDLVDSYLAAIDRELAWLERPRRVDSLYFGGGTPTHLAPGPLHRLITTTRRWLVLDPAYEFSVEANPLDVTEPRIEVLRSSGVNRASLGVQSFDDQKLTLLERDHRRGDIEKSVRLLQEAIPEVSLDLIFGTPGETTLGWRADVEQAIQFRPDHISVYGLTWERGTSFWSRRHQGELVACAEDTERDMYESAIDLLAEAGYEHYEVSNFALPGKRCRHNENYWLGGTYFAAGPGAARHVDGRRELNHRSTTTYLRRVLANHSPVADSEMLSDEESARERLVFGMRRLEGVDERRFSAETGFEVASLVAEPLERFLDMEWIARTGSRIHLTRRGLLISDSLWPEFLQPTVSDTTGKTRS